MGQHGGKRVGVSKLVRQRLVPRKDKGKAEIIFIGDVHYGARNCDVERFEAMLNYCLENKVYVMLMGDLLESATRYSIGSGVYEQLSPQEQIEHMTNYLKPLADAGLIISLLAGNHESRILKETGVDVCKNMARELGIQYVGAAGWHLLYVGDQSYTIYALHGASGSRLAHTKMKAVADIANFFSADIISMGHVHALLTHSMERQEVCKSTKTVEVKKTHIILTGSYLKYDGSYAQAAGMPPTKLGSPKLILEAEKWDIHISI